SGKTRSEVAERLKEVLRDQQLGLPVRSEKQTVADFLHFWLNETVKNSVRPKSFVFYESIIRLHLVPEIGDLRLQKLTPQHVQKLLNTKLGSGLSGRMVCHIRTTLVTALQVALKFGTVARNVASLVDPPRTEKAEIKVLNLDQARHFLNAIKGDRQYALFATTLVLGLRLGEALGLTWDDLDFERGNLTVKRALQRIDGKPQLVEPKSATSRRRVVLPAVAVAALQHHRAQQEHERAVAGTAWKGNPWNLVFTSTVGTPLFHRNVHRRFCELVKLAGLPPMRPHDLRHSAVALLIAQGVHAKAIQELLGHSSVAFTLQVYGHLFDEAKRETADRMDAVFEPVASTMASTGSKEPVN
ncbi:MAG: site-specific integrase, partial [Acidobacteria bacterium]|nr:site-specific integrase [Acidobacteriota bacterium]